jgi:kynureninase
MTLDKAIKVKFPKSGAARFTVWDELNRSIFNSEMYAKGEYPAHLLNKPVTGISVGCLVGGDEVMCITVDTGEKAIQEILAAAYKLESHCEQIMKDPNRNCHDCVFWKDYCVIRDEAPAGWDIPIGGAEE